MTEQDAAVNRARVDFEPTQPLPLRQDPVHVIYERRTALRLIVDILHDESYTPEAKLERILIVAQSGLDRSG